MCLKKRGEDEDNVGRHQEIDWIKPVWVHSNNVVQDVEDSLCLIFFYGDGTLLITQIIFKDNTIYNHKKKKKKNEE